MNKPLLILPVLVALPALPSCSTEQKTAAAAWEIHPILRVRNSTENPVAYYQLGRFYQEQDRHDKAIDAFEKAVAIDSKYAEAHNALGVSYAALGKLNRAVEQFNAAIALDPETSHYHNNLGYARYLEQDYQPAVAELQKAVALDPQAEKAAANYRQALASTPAETAATAVAQQTVGAPAQAAAAATAAAQPDTTAVAKAPSLAPAPRQETVKDAGATPEASRAIAAATQATESPTTQPKTAVPAAPIATLADSAVKAPAVPAAQSDAAPQLAAVTAPPANLPAANANKESTSAAMSPRVETLSEQASRERGYEMLKNYRFEIANGNGVAGMARRVNKELATAGVPPAHLTNQKPFRQPSTYVQYREGYKELAEQLSAQLPNNPPTRQSMQLRASTDVRLVLGKDVAQGLALLYKAKPDGTRLVWNQVKPLPASE